MSYQVGTNVKVCRKSALVYGLLSDISGLGVWGAGLSEGVSAVFAGW